jgi:heme/copper-type cytochrome/quinol oxidase subunit 2
MSIADMEAPAPRDWRRWFAFLGGGFAWTFHLLSIYAVGEFGCVSGMDSIAYAGISMVAWMILILSAVALAVAMAAAFVGYRDKRRDNAQKVSRPEEDGGRFLSSFGFLLSSLFVFIIIVETMPVFAYLDGC